MFALVLWSPPPTASKRCIVLRPTSIPPTPSSTQVSSRTDADGSPLTCGGVVGLQPSTFGRVRVGARNVTMGFIVTALTEAGNLDCTILDQTGFSGIFDFTFEWAPLPKGLQISH